MSAPNKNAGGSSLLSLLESVESAVDVIFESEASEAVATDSFVSVGLVVSLVVTVVTTGVTVLGVVESSALLVELDGLFESVIPDPVELGTELVGFEVVPWDVKLGEVSVVAGSVFVDVVLSFELSESLGVDGPAGVVPQPVATIATAK